MSTLPWLLLLALPGQKLQASPTLWETIQFQLTGLAIVMTALAGLWLISAMIGRVFITIDGRRQAAVKAPAPTVATAVDAPMAVIAAAVAAVVDEPHRLVSISPTDQNNAWAAHGRAQIFNSRRVPRRS